ncbi:MAG: chaperone protein DnaJ [Methanosaeta sp. PtaB.Bin039]|nr:MAG: chaperone protein DnaJ [Methanosaeta sp. PtaB.Bin039]OPY45874.1 MAG: chaperone protein DnaJ [Methanosaeta sp. PtaU1.Bin028]HOT07826.1 molecular chaperone DnaJ [Methanotrichaceae archaeon]HQF17541.1 molecular chaperone DnaJ [Methanotrichaceae archaeon]HQI92117.1 molecular chaperone DnaJ [Methanotrichaceae archaeon]
MPDKKDYYEVLGVDKGATEKDIKSAYRKLAMKYHPDRSDAPDAESRFKEISEAYAVLSDQEKRRQYDQFGHAGMGQYSQEDLFRGVDFEDLLRGFGFGGGRDSIFDAFFGGRRGQPARGRDLRYDLDLTLEQAATGLETTIEVPRAEICQTCSGSGAKPGTSPVSCPNCHGSGQITRAQNTPFGQMISSSPCPKCSGRGQTIPNPCQDCSGTGRVRRVRKIAVKIPGGVDSGQHLKLRGQGEAGPTVPGHMGAESGDLYVFVSVRPHPLFRRDDADLLHEASISMTQAALGDDIEVPTLQGRARLKVPAGTQSGSIFRMRGKGMPRLHGSGTGDLHVRLNVRIPTALTPRQKQLLEDLSAEMGETRPEQKSAERKAGERKAGDKSILDKIVDEVKGAVR